VAQREEFTMKTLNKNGIWVRKQPRRPVTCNKPNTRRVFKQTACFDEGGMK
jgi:hypothetical protein